MIEDQADLLIGPLKICPLRNPGNQAGIILQPRLQMNCGRQYAVAIDATSDLKSPVLFEDANRLSEHVANDDGRDCVKAYRTSDTPGEEIISGARPPGQSRQAERLSNAHPPATNVPSRATLDNRSLAHRPQVPQDWYWRYGCERTILNKLSRRNEVLLARFFPNSSCSLLHVSLRMQMQRY
jgi:hypothetical protein